MGYGAGHDIKLNLKGYGYAVFTGKTLKILDDGAMVESWDLTHPMDGMKNIKPSLLKVKFNPIILDEKTILWMKQHD